ncbi:element excision factor XisH family protein [Leptodesmis sp.]|uniref:element excision factor XisH family protein n=1 Tax=Leptodesmis sp. TaxID=3100501 RepID=UPI004053579D
MAAEVKRFTNPPAISELHTAVGQYLNYWLFVSELCRLCDRDRNPVPARNRRNDSQT